MFRIGIIGAGWIARKMCRAIAPFTDLEIYAIASRTLETDWFTRQLTDSRPQ